MRNEGNNNELREKSEVNVVWPYGPCGVLESSAPQGGGNAPRPVAPAASGDREEEGGRRQTGALQYMRPCERSLSLGPFFSSSSDDNGGKHSSGFLLGEVSQKV